MSPSDNDGTLNARVSVLEDWRREHREWMVEMRSAMAGVQTSLQALRLCNSPNTCLTLRDEISEMAQENKNAMLRIESLERWRTFISGVIATLGGVWLVMQVILPWIFKAMGQE